MRNAIHVCMVDGIHGIDECNMGVDGWIDDKLFVDCRVLYDCADEEVHGHRQYFSIFK